jgi:nanoRNase/pAp phosphatase (c-di-AMP/oligoRNAs hydrolase)
VNKLLALLRERPAAFVVTHDNPDPDAIGAALCLRHLLNEALDTRARIVYGGMIGRGENRHMVRALEVPLERLEQVEFGADDAVIVVDTQPGFGNNSLPPHLDVVAVIDHHEGPPLHNVPHVDVRPSYGAACSILTEYIVSAAVPLTSQLATAICYGIASETQDLGREAARADVAAFLAAFPESNQPLLGRLRHPPREVSFFLQLDRAIRTTRVADGVGVCHMGAIPDPDVPAEMADMLVSVDGIDWAMCTGVRDGRLIVSLRTVLTDANAGELLRSVVGQSKQAGGHGMIAGGSVDVAGKADRQAVEERLARRLLTALHRDPDAERLLLTNLPDRPPPSA